MTTTDHQSDLRIDPVDPITLDIPTTTAVSRATYGKRIPPSRRMFAKRSPSRRSFGRRVAPSRRTFGWRGPSVRTGI